VQAVLPAGGPVEGGTRVSVIGQNLLAGLVVDVGGRPMSEVEVFSTTLVSGVVPAGTAGAYDVRVTNQDGQTSSKTHGFVYLDPAAMQPAVDSIVPSEGSTAGETEVTILGQGFQPGARVLLGALPLAHVEFVSAQEIRGRTGAGAPGVFAVRVWNPDGKTNVIATVFRYSDISTPVSLLDPKCAGTNFSFTFLTRTNQHYTLEYKEELGGTGGWHTWGTYNGNGSNVYCLVPVTNAAATFFRIREP
jgi:hypothetical protein